MTIAPPPAATEPLDVAALVRAASADDHRAAETRGFITALMGGELSLDEYTRYLAQLAWVYDALEERGSRPGDPAVFDPALARMAAIDADLAALGASDWREAHPPLPATADYAAHLRADRRRRRALPRPPLHALPRRPLGRPGHRRARRTPLRRDARATRLLPVRGRRRRRGPLQEAATARP